MTLDPNHVSPEVQSALLKILMIAPTSFFNDYGGHIRILEETMALQSLGHQVTIVTYYKGNDVDGLDIRRTAALPWRSDYEVGSSRHKLAFDAYLAVKAARVAAQVRPDVIHGHMHEGALIGGFLARLLRLPLVFDFQGGLTGEMVDHGFLNPRGRLFPWAYRLERAICHLPQAILTSSLRAKSLLENEFEVQEGIVHPLPDCVDIQRFSPDRFSHSHKEALRARLGLPPDRPIIAYLGLLADYQGIPDIIQAAAALKARERPFHFLMMGYPRVQQYVRLAEYWGVDEHMTFTGKVPYSSAPYFLALGDLAISAKTSATEGSGKVLNYMAMSQPVVAYDTPVHREYLGELGVYAPIGDVPALTEAIDSLILDETRRQCLGIELRRRAAARYSWQHAGQRISKVYATLTTP